MPAGRYFRDAIIGWVQGTTMPAAPSSVWAHLVTSSPSPTAPGDEPVVGGYAPIEITAWAATVEGASYDTANPSSALSFGPFTEDGASDAVAVVLMDGEDPGTAEIIVYGTLATARPFVDGGYIEIAAADFDVRA